ncbi:MAG: T9SS type A sorting domain-containing protein [Saprospiraceae bacterium]
MIYEIQFFMRRLVVLLSLAVFICQLSFAQCTEDCVWPGDMNANGIANSLDVLAIGLAWGETGPSRTDTSTDWEALDATDWLGNLPTLGTNHKHADADGDGALTEQDLLPININYNKTNDNFTGLLGNEIVGSDLFAIPQSTIVSTGASLFLDIHLGDANNEITDIHGVGFQLDLDTQYVAEVLFDFSESWLGSEDELLEYGKYNGEHDHAGMAITRKDGTTVNGFGRIARVEIVIVDVILAMEVDTTVCIPFNFGFKNVLGINAEEADLMISALPDSVNLKHESQLTTLAKEPQAATFNLDVYPNPASEVIHIRHTAQPINQICFYNQLGQRTYEKTFSQDRSMQSGDQIRLPELSKGLYFVRFESGSVHVVRKILIE